MPEEQEEESFSFVDKRRAGVETSPTDATESEPTADQAAESTAEDSAESIEDIEEEFDPQATGIPQLNVRDRIFMSIDILHQGAWISMGLRADPATGEVQQDLEAARLAIDCVTFLASKIEDALDDATRRELKRVVSDLQMNYVNQTQRAQRGSSNEQ